MKTLIYTLPLLLVIQACSKSNPPPLQPSDPNKHINYTILDKITNQPVDSVAATLVYGNGWSESALSDVNGNVSFSIPKTWVVNSISMSKQDYCYYISSPNAVNVPNHQTVYLDHFAYIRFIVVNQPPAVGSDRLEIGFPPPTLTGGNTVNFYGAVNTTTVVEALAGNLGIACNLYSGTTYLSSNHVFVTTIGGDTIDVPINF